MSKAKNIFAAVAALSIISCVREINGPEERPISFSVIVEDLSQPEDTKSVLSGDDIETKVTSLTLGLYSNGTLKDRLYFGPGGDLGIDDFASYSVDLAFCYGCEVVALANMGDMRGSLPAAVSGIASINYRIPGYTSPSGNCVQNRGIPMAGRVVLAEDAFVSAALHGTTVQLPLRRLLAKVAVDLSVGWPGYIQSVKIRNLNAVLRPFSEGGSAAASAADILAEEEIETGTDAREGTFVFYVPENRQGSVDGITSSFDKSADNSLLSGKTAVLTYMEVLVEGKGDGVDKQEAVGSITYRSYIGDNATSNFDIVGNCRYTWTVNYLPEGMINQDWKHENALSWFMPRYYFYPAGLTKMQWTDQKIAYLLRIYDSYGNGALTSRERGEYPDDYYDNMSEYEMVDITGFTYYYDDPADDSVRDDGYVITVSSLSYTTQYLNVTGRGEGTRRLHFLIDDNYGHHDVWGDFYCTGYINEVSITGSAATVRPNEPVTFTASVKRIFANGNKTVLNDNVASHYSWPFSKENANGEYIYYNTRTMTTKTGNQITFTPTQAGNYEVFVSYTDQETGVSSKSDDLNFTVDSGIYLELSASTPSTQVGSSIQLTLYQVDAAGTRTDVSSWVGSSGWKAYMPDGTTVNSDISINASYRRATASTATSGVIRATYDGRTSNDVAVEWKEAPTLTVGPSSLSWTASQKYVSKYAYVNTNLRDDITIEVTGADASDLYYKLGSTAETSGTYAGRYQLTAYFKTANTSATAKSATITLRVGARTATVTCTQAKAENISLTPTELEWEWNETAEKTATITTNVSSLYIFTGGDAASAVTASRSGNTLSVSWNSINNSTTERGATVTVANASTLANATVTAVLTVRQAGKPVTPTLSVDKTSLSWAYNKYGSGNAKTVKVTSNIPQESLSAMVSGTNASDVSYSLDESGTEGVYDLTVYFSSKNSGSADREAKISISGTGTYSSVTPVGVSLAQTYHPSVTVSGTGILEWDWDQYGQTSVKTISFKTSVSRENIYCEVTSGNGSNVTYSISNTANSSGYYTLSVWWNSKNTGADDREADIAFHSYDGRSVTANKTVTVRQHGKPADPTISLSETAFVWNHAKHGYDNAETVTVVTNYPVSDLAFSKSGSGELDYEVSPTGENTAIIKLWWPGANEYPAAREGTLAVSINGVSATVSFKQTAKPGFNPEGDDDGGEINPDF